MSLAKWKYSFLNFFKFKIVNKFDLTSSLSTLFNRVYSKKHSQSAYFILPKKRLTRKPTNNTIKKPPYPAHKSIIKAKISIILVPPFFRTS